MRRGYQKAPIARPAPDSTSPHGRAPASTPSTIVFNVACGAGMSVDPNSYARPSSMTVARGHGENEPGRLGCERHGRIRADERREHDRGDERSRHEHTRLLVAEDEADADERRREFQREVGLRQHWQGGVHRVRHEEREGAQQLHRRPQPHAVEDPDARGSADCRGAQHFRARRALGMRQLVVRLDDEQAAERDHGREAEYRAKE
jgi:hypothetical protein